MLIVMREDSGQQKEGRFRIRLSGEVKDNAGHGKIEVCCQEEWKHFTG